MKVYQEVHFDLAKTSEDDFLKCVIAFCESSRGWRWHEDKTGRLDRDVNESAFSVLYEEYDDSVSPLVHVARKEGKVFHITNVTPRAISPNKISSHDYNMVAKRFGLDFRRFSKGRSLGISVYIPKADLSLRQIIKSKVARTAFERYLSYPLRGHDCDDDPLHDFTCTLFRGNVHCSLEHLQRYVLEDCCFTSTEAEDFRRKVEIGLRVLQVCKRY
jgi:hypothetical protein